MSIDTSSTRSGASAIALNEINRTQVLDKIHALWHIMIRVDGNIVGKFEVIHGLQDR